MHVEFKMLYLVENWLFYGVCKGCVTFSLGCGLNDFDHSYMFPAPSLVIAIFKFAMACMTYLNVLMFWVSQTQVN